MMKVHVPQVEPWSRAATRWLLLVVLLAGGLRLLPVLFSSVARGDGLTRMLFAWEFAKEPTWQGLTGIWLPVHWYALGTLVRIWPDPLTLSKILGWVFGTGTVALLFVTVRRLYGTAAAGWAGILMSLYWFHVWLTPTNFVDLYVFFFQVLAVYGAIRAGELRGQTGLWRFAALAGVGAGITVLLRHEFKLSLGLFAAWLFFAAGWRAFLVFSLVGGLPVLAQFAEYIGTGRGIFADAETASRMKAYESSFMGTGRMDGLFRWGKLTAGSPTLFVAVPGLYGLWLKRRVLLRDPMVLLMVILTGFHLVLTIFKGWQPQGRYLMHYYFPLLVYAGVAYSHWLANNRKWLVAGLLALLVLNQAGAWFIRNDRQVAGVLPIQMDSREQRAVNEFYKSVPRSARFADFTNAEDWSLRVTLAKLNRWDDFDQHIFRAQDEQEQILREGFGKYDISKVNYVLLRPGSKMHEAVERGFPQINLKLVEQQRRVGIYRVTGKSANPA